MSADPRISNRVLVCRDCGAPLEIVCPTHGRTVSRIVEDTPQTKASSPHTAREPKAGSVRGRIRDHVALHSAEHPCSTQQVADALLISVAHAAVELSYLLNHGMVRRVGRGLYAGPLP